MPPTTYKQGSKFPVISSTMQQAINRRNSLAGHDIEVIIDNLKELEESVIEAVSTVDITKVETLQSMLSQISNSRMQLKDVFINELAAYEVSQEVRSYDFLP